MSQIRRGSLVEGEQDIVGMEPHQAGIRSSSLVVGSESDPCSPSNCALKQMEADREVCSRVERVCRGKHVVGGRRMASCEWENSRKLERSQGITTLARSVGSVDEMVSHNRWYWYS
jgi:hypothetical protein